MIESPCPTDAELAAFLSGQTVDRPLEWLAGHLLACTQCQQRLEQLEDRPDPVVQMIRRPPPPAWGEPAPSFASRPTEPFSPSRPRILQPLLSAADTRLLYYHRVRLGTLVLAVVLPSLLALRLIDPQTLMTQDSVGPLGMYLFAAVPCYAAALAIYLWLRPDVSLSRLRWLTSVLFVLCVVVVSCRQYLHLVSSPPGGFEGPQHASTYLTGASILSILAWIVIMVNYGVMVPEVWPRVLAVVAAMALVSLAILVAAGLASSAVRQQWPYLLMWSALVLSLGAATATYASFQISALRREASEARQLGQYHLQRRLGAGGMGEVYLAEHRLLKRPCAVKLIRPEYAGDPALLRRFEREVRAIAELSHPNTVNIYDYGHAEDGTFYYVMEYLPGLNLDELVLQHGPLPPGRAVYFLRQLCAALNEAHSAGLVHRDIKPGNVIVCRYGGMEDVAKLLDFGLVRGTGWSGPEESRLTAKGTVVGTPDFMAPEQARGDEADPRSDLYSLGALGYFLLTGHPPFERETAMEILVAHLREPVPPLTDWLPDIPADVQAIVLRCLSKPASDRFPTALALDEALGQCACAGQWSQAQARAWWQANSPLVRRGAR